MVDFLILFEHKNRELENSALLAAELEYRGYTVKFANIYGIQKYFTKARVVVAPHLYDDEQVIQFGKNIWLSNKKIVSLQYEQIHRKTQCNGYLEPKGQALSAYHLAWGQAQKEEYLRRGVEESHIGITNHIAMDLMDSKFDDLFLSRDEMAVRFNLDPNKKWVLFISTFAHKLKTETEKKAYAKIDSGAEEQINNSILAQSIILDWLVDIAQNKDLIIIYRRHPSERLDEDIVRITKQLSNFRYIDELTMRQWARVSDRMYTWYSTSIADAYYGKRRCAILRPFDLPQELELSIMIDAKSIKDKETLIEDINSESFEFPISDEKMKYYYGKEAGDEEYAFIKVADVLEHVLNDDSYRHDYDYGRSRWNIYNYRGVHRIIGTWAYLILYEIAKFIYIPVPVKWRKNKYFRKYMKFHDEGHHSKREYNSRKKQFKAIVSRIHSDS